MATIPYIKGTSENIAWILQPRNIPVAHKPITTLRQLRTKVKDKVDQRTDRERYTRSNAATAAQLTSAGRNLNTRLTEHRRATKNGDNKNNIAEHYLQTDRRMDWDSADYQRHTVESWFTNLERTPLKQCQQLPAPYKRLINDKQKKLGKQTNQTQDRGISLYSQ